MLNFTQLINAMILHRPLVLAVVEILENVFQNNMYTDKAISSTIKNNRQFGGRDRRFITKAVYDFVRWKRLIEYCLNVNTKEDLDYFLLLGGLLVTQGVELPPWKEFDSLNKEIINKRKEEGRKIRKIGESIPDWIDELGVEELGEVVWNNELEALNKEAIVVLRANALKSNAQKLIERLAKQNIISQTLRYEIPIWDAVRKYAVEVVDRQKLFHLKEYKDGLFEIQDASSQLIANCLNLKEGKVLIDACAGAGGKSLHAAAIMNNTGTVYACDIHERKLIELNNRAKRAGVTIITTALIDSEFVQEKNETADYLLLDVPCTGLGVLKRKPDTKWKLTPKRLDELLITQRNILKNYSSMLKIGGVMVYATCSILPKENRDQINYFLKRNDKFRLKHELAIMPSDGYDGFYAAILHKDG